MPRARNESETYSHNEMGKQTRGWDHGFTHTRYRHDGGARSYGSRDAHHGDTSPLRIPLGMTSLRGQMGPTELLLFF